MSSDMPAGGSTTDDDTIRPFQVDIPEEAIVDLRRRIAAWRPPEPEPVDDQSQGVQLATVQALADYWATDYDWRKVEAKLNALPLIVSHGWPGSIIEQLKIIEPLTNPTEHGASASDAFDVVIPSLLLGIHVNFAQMVPLEVLGHIRNGDPAPADLSDAEKRAYGQVAFATDRRGYGVIQGTRPQTIGYSLADTPVGLAAWFLDHDTTSYEHLARLFAGQPFGAITRDDVLDNTSLYWFTNTATSAARLYWEQGRAGGNFYAAADLSFPAAVTVFPEEYVQAPRSWTERAYHNLIYFNEADEGGHFAAWEQPQLFTFLLART
jgi:Epoxide hydrolase N terminus